MFSFCLVVDSYLTISLCWLLYSWAEKESSLWPEGCQEITTIRFNSWQLIRFILEVYLKESKEGSYVVASSSGPG